MMMIMRAGPNESERSSARVGLMHGLFSNACYSYDVQRHVNKIRKYKELSQEIYCVIRKLF